MPSPWPYRFCHCHQAKMSIVQEKHLPTRQAMQAMSRGTVWTMRTNRLHRPYQGQAARHVGHPAMEGVLLEAGSRIAEPVLSYNPLPSGLFPSARRNCSREAQSAGRVACRRMRYCDSGGENEGQTSLACSPHSAPAVRRHKSTPV